MLSEVKEQYRSSLSPDSSRDSNCSICWHASFPVFTLHGWTLYECRNCHHRFTPVPDGTLHTASHYGDSYFTGGGAGYSDYLSEGNLLRQCGVRYSEILERCSPTGKRILGIGCAAGFILDGFRSKGWSCKGIEPNEAMGEYARGILGLDVETSSLELSQIQETFDVVEMIQVIAHITSPQKSFERVSQWLNPKGLLLVETWNYQSWTAKLCGQKWHEYSPPTVVQWFTPTTLSRLAADHGLELVASGRPSKWIEAGHAKSILHYKYSSKLARRLLSPLACIPNRLAVPYPADDLFWAIYRKRESSN